MRLDQMKLLELGEMNAIHNAISLVKVIKGLLLSLIGLQQTRSHTLEEGHFEYCCMLGTGYVCDI